MSCRAASVRQPVSPHGLRVGCCTSILAACEQKALGRVDPLVKACAYKRDSDSCGGASVQGACMRGRLAFWKLNNHSPVARSPAQQEAGKAYQHCLMCGSSADGISDQLLTTPIPTPAPTAANTPTTTGRPHVARKAMHAPPTVPPAKLVEKPSPKASCGEEAQRAQHRCKGV